MVFCRSVSVLCMSLSFVCKTPHFLRHKSLVTYPAIVRRFLMALNSFGSAAAEVQQQQPSPLPITVHLMLKNRLLACEVKR